MPRKILVLSRDQGAHEVDGAGPDDRQGVRGVIPFVEDEGDVGHPLGERLTAGQELLGHALEGHRVVLIARVGVMEERDLTIGRGPAAADWPGPPCCGPAAAAWRAR
jgi:hypothetical protein